MVKVAKTNDTRSYMMSVKALTLLIGTLALVDYADAGTTAPQVEQAQSPAECRPNRPVRLTSGRHNRSHCNTTQPAPSAQVAPDRSASGCRRNRPVSSSANRHSRRRCISTQPTSNVRVAGRAGCRSNRPVSSAANRHSRRHCDSAARPDEPVELATVR
jgi:hypothetical protein